MVVVVVDDPISYIHFYTIDMHTTSKMKVSTMDKKSLLSTRLFHLAIEENNTGVDFFNQGSYDSSIQALHCALECLQQFQKHHHRRRRNERTTEPTNPTTSETETNGPSKATWCNSGIVDIDDQTLPANCRRASTETSPNIDSVAAAAAAAATTKTTTASRAIRIDQNTMYGCALYLSCHGDCQEAFANPSRSCSGSDLVRIEASILFNMGLAHHTQAALLDSREGEVLATMLEKAILLYELSLGIQEKSQAPISQMYLMALCNNIGQCHASLLRYSEAYDWNERLLCLMVRQTTSGGDQNERDHDHAYPRNCECFFYNTMSLILRDPCLSPAA